MAVEFVAPGLTSAFELGDDSSDLAMNGEAKLISMSGPETDNEDTPPLAPA